MSTPALSAAEAGSSNPNPNPKRKSDTASSEQSKAKKTRVVGSRSAKGKGKGNGKEAYWPEYFQQLSKIFQALNTVLAFCSSRKHIATTFPTVRTSVEKLLGGPLELEKIAELKALLPRLVEFAYKPNRDIRVNGTSTDRQPSPDFGKFEDQRLRDGKFKEPEYVLVLEFHDSSKGKKAQDVGLIPAPALTPAGVKKLVEKRNEAFNRAVDELLEASSVSSEEPVALLKAAARDHVPVDPAARALLAFTDSKREGQAIPDSAGRPSIIQTIVDVEEESWYDDEISWRRTFEAKDGKIATLDAPLSESIQHALSEARGITSLYTHQAAAISALARNEHVIVSTSTASGKSVIYQALAQDQRAALEQLLFQCPGLEHVSVATYDGDTPQENRRSIRENASIIFTNFDMIHASILPHEDLWRRFLKNLKIVAVDELHYYHGLFGSHAAMVMRRLRRICAAVGNRRVRFVSCSATIEKPKEHMKNIFGLDDVTAITEDGAPSGRKDFLIWEPGWIDPKDHSLGKRNSMVQATGLMRYLMKRGIRVILFCKRQQIGRAGRRARDALAVLVSDGLMLDEHYVANPNELFDSPMDDLVIDLDSKSIIEAHLQCAAHEMPMSLEDEKWFGHWTKQLCQTKLVKDKEGWFHTHPKYLPYPAKEVSLRGAQEERYCLLDVSNQDNADGTVRILEEVEVSRALFEVYEGAIFIHQGIPFLVQDVNHDTKQARAIRTDANWITAPRDFTDVDAVQTQRIREIHGSSRRAFYGRVDVKTVVFGFFKMRAGVILDAVDVDMPPYERRTTGMWIDISAPTLAMMNQRNIRPSAAIHSAEHAFLNRFDMASAVRTECKAPEKEFKTSPTERKRPARLIFYDIPDKGGGFTAKAFDHTSELLRHALDVVSSCDCQDGCATCIAGPYCEERNEVSSKIGAVVVLKDILNVDIDWDSIEYQVSEGANFPTIVEAEVIPIRPVEGIVVEKDDA
ncbi:hypothetical protein EWM64_g2254 [Hericium alpestre]|uniref:Helicase ATP-binding domain-containing protein n=1 Tax=Hericium alpestre TaxID=135208 RepID=A0A4Z0A4W6_9AGAM|nr:hypothetical protein EWM64_g2254 [Hericium alpestre]